MTDKPQPVDWRTLPAGLELDRLIAERLGWTGIDQLSPTELWGISPSKHGGTLPHWSTSVDDALTLWDNNMRWEFKYADGHYEFTPVTSDVLDKHGNPDQLAWGAADAPALAVCRARLAWMDRSS